jgi:single-strand DNA-binding protein
MEGTTYPRMNRVLLTGIAQEEPELRYTPSGVAVCSLRVQVGRILRDRSGGAREVAAYLTVVAWQEAAQRMARELRKGQAVYVEGYVSSRSFTTARGEKRTAVEIYAEQIQILGPLAEGEKPTEGQTHGEEGNAPRGGGRRPATRGREAHPGEGGEPLPEEHHEMPHPAEDHQAEDHHVEEPPGPEAAGESEKLPL